MASTERSPSSSLSPDSSSNSLSDTTHIGFVNSMESDTEVMKPCQHAAAVIAEAHRAIVQQCSSDADSSRIYRTPSTSNTDHAGGFSHDSAEFTGSSHHAPIVVDDDDDSTSTTSSETLRADGVSSSLENNSDNGNDIAGVHRDDEVREWESEDVEVHCDDDEKYNSGFDSDDRDECEFLRKEGGILLGRFDKMSAIMTEIAINLDALEGHLKAGTIEYEFAFRMESFDNLRTMVDEMNADIEVLDLKASCLNAETQHDRIFVEAVKERCRKMNLVESGIGVNRRIADIDRGIRDIIEQHPPTLLTDKLNAQDEPEGGGRAVTSPQPPIPAELPLDTSHLLALPLPQTYFTPQFAPPSMYPYGYGSFPQQLPPVRSWGLPYMPPLNPMTLPSGISMTWPPYLRQPLVYPTYDRPVSSVRDHTHESRSDHTLGDYTPESHIVDSSIQYHELQQAGQHFHENRTRQDHDVEGYTHGFIKLVEAIFINVNLMDDSIVVVQCNGEFPEILSL